VFLVTTGHRYFHAPLASKIHKTLHSTSNFATFRFANGDNYAGEFKNMVRDGRGTYVGVDGGKYAGGWKQGRYHGLGTLLLPNGRGVQAGRWDKNKFVGDPGAAGLTGGAM